MIFLGADHGGFPLKEKIKEWLTEWGMAFTDLGAKTLQEDDDYPTYAFAVGEEIGSTDRPELPWKDRPKGILSCRSAAGVVIAANKVRSVRAVAVFDELSAKHSREHNDANVLALSGDWTKEEDAKKMIKIWLETEFSNEERHKRRLLEIYDYEMLGGGGCGGSCGGGGCC